MSGGEKMPEITSPTIEFISVANEFRHEYIVEKSRFITTICPCSTETDAQDFINRINKEFWDARHNCTAYALGPKQEQQRSSDNGEPSGTAGKPMLEVLKKTGIYHTVKFYLFCFRSAILSELAQTVFYNSR